MTFGEIRPMLNSEALILTTERANGETEHEAIHRDLTLDAGEKLARHEGDLVTGLRATETMWGKRRIVLTLEVTLREP